MLRNLCYLVNSPQGDTTNGPPAEQGGIERRFTCLVQLPFRVGNTQSPKSPFLPTKLAMKPSTEIDDIFAGLSKSSKAVLTSKPTVESSSTLATAEHTPSTTSKKKKKKKNAAAAEAADGQTKLGKSLEDTSKDISVSTQKRVPETVVDPSISISTWSSSNPSTKGRRKLETVIGDVDAQQLTKRIRTVAPVDDQEAKFRDSRGTAGRTSAISNSERNHSIIEELVYCREDNRGRLGRV